MSRRSSKRDRKRGMSYELRVSMVNRIYDEHKAEGLSNREIWRRYVYPVYGICERSFYNLLKASSRGGDAFAAGEGASLFEGMEGF